MRPEFELRNAVVQLMSCSYNEADQWIMDSKVLVDGQIISAPWKKLRSGLHIVSIKNNLFEIVVRVKSLVHAKKMTGVK